MPLKRMKLKFILAFILTVKLSFCRSIPITKSFGFPKGRNLGISYEPAIQRSIAERSSIKGVPQPGAGSLTGHIIIMMSSSTVDQYENLRKQPQPRRGNGLSGSVYVNMININI